jgi:hypothetical protein
MIGQRGKDGRLIWNSKNDIEKFLILRYWGLANKKLEIWFNLLIRNGEQLQGCSPFFYYSLTIPLIFRPIPICSIRATSEFASLISNKE